jgi:hypothetical protein
VRIPLYILFAIAFLASASFAADYTGKVLAPDGKPVKGATVYLFNFSNNPASPTTQRDAPTTQTDDAGSFQISNTEKGQHLLVATADGYGPGAAGFQNSSAVIKLSRCTDAALTFLDAANKPIAHLPVYVAQIGQLPMPDGTLEVLFIPSNYHSPWTAVTDDNGQCTISGLPQNTQLALGVDDPPYAQPSFRNIVSLGSSAHTKADPIHLSLASSISGTVTYSTTNKPAGGIFVEVQSDQGAVGNAVSNADGSYTINRLSAGTYTLELGVDTNREKTWTAKANENVAVAAGATKSGVDFSLIPGAILSGTVIAADDGKPIAGVPVGVFGPARPRAGREAQTAYSDANGAFSMRVPPGEQLIFIRSENPAPGYGRPSPDNQTVTIADGATGTVEFRLPRVLMSPITGKVVDPDGNPVSGASVYVSSDLMPMFNRVAVTTNSDGVFQSLPMQRVGRIEIRAKFHDLATLKPVMISQTASEIVIHLEKNALASISGRVVDPQGNPLNGAPITLEIRQPRYSFGQDAGKTDANGNFKIDSLWPDLSYVVVTSRDGYGQIVSNQLRIEPGQDMHLPDLTLYKRDTTITGLLLDENDKPVTGKRIFVRGTKSGSTNINTDSSGKFSCAVVSNDPLTIFYNLDGRGPYRRQTAHAGDQNIVLHTSPPRPAPVAAPVHVEVAAPQPAASSDSQAAAPPQAVFDPTTAVTWNGWLYAGITLVICTFITAIASAIFAILKRKTA